MIEIHGHGRLLAALSISALAACADPLDAPATSVERTLRGAIRFPSATDLRRAPSSITHEFVDRFAIGQHVAERFARGYAAQKAPLGASKLQLCLALPKQNDGEVPVGWLFVLSDTSCRSWEQLLAVARGIWRAVGVRSPADLNQQSLAAALRRSAEQFFTIIVSAHTFRHPLHEAQRGLAPWILDAALREASLRRCNPVALSRPQISERHFEIVRYRCATKYRVFSHSRRMELSPSQLSGPRANHARRAFARLQRVLCRKYDGQALEAVLDRKREVWLRYLQ